MELRAVGEGADHGEGLYGGDSTLWRDAVVSPCTPYKYTYREVLQVLGGDSASIGI